MKTPITFLMLFIYSTLTVWAQPAYTLKTSQANYADLQGDVVILADTVYPLAAITVPKAFKVFGHSLPDTLSVGRNGFIVCAGNEFAFAIDPYLVGNTFPDSDSRVSVALEGAVGQRILKIQWKNVGTATDSSLRFNYQCWMYEADQAVEFRFGPGSNPNSGFSGLFLLSRDFSQAYEIFVIHGDPAMPAVETLQSLPIQSGPASGTVYRMEYLRLDAPQTEALSLHVYPNPGTGKFQIQGLELADVKVYDAKGQAVAVKQEGDTFILEQATPGLYRIVARAADFSVYSTSWLLR